MLTNEDSFLHGEMTNFDFTVDNVHYSGTHTGMLAYRANEKSVYTEGTQLFIDGQKVELFC